MRFTNRTCGVFTMDSPCLYMCVLSACIRRKADMAAGKVPASPSNFLDTLLLARDTNGDKLSDDAVQEEVDTFMFEGGVVYSLHRTACCG